MSDPTRIEGAPARVLHMLHAARCKPAGTQGDWRGVHAEGWRGVGREGFTRATAARLERLGLIELRATSAPGVYLFDARITLAGVVAAEALR